MLHFETIEIPDPTTHEMRDLFARDGDEVLVNTRGKSRGHGAGRISLATAQLMVRASGIKLTPEQAQALDMA